MKTEGGVTDGTTRQKGTKEDRHSFIHSKTPVHKRFILNLQRRFMMLTLFQGRR